MEVCYLSHDIKRYLFGLGQRGADVQFAFSVDSNFRPRWKVVRGRVLTVKVRVLTGWVDK